MINTYKKEKETFIKTVSTYDSSYNSEDYVIKKANDLYGEIYYNVYKKAKTVLTDVQINEKDIYKTVKIDDEYSYAYVRRCFNPFEICAIVSLYIIFLPIALIVGLFSKDYYKYIIRTKDLITNK